MRDLTRKQKELLRNYSLKFFKESGGNWMNMENMPMAWYEEIEEINDTEVLYQNVERFLYDYRSELTKRLTEKEKILSIY